MSQYGQKNQYGPMSNNSVTINSPAPESETRASAISGTGTSGIMFVSKLLGVNGNTISFRISTSLDDTLRVVVAGKEIDIQLANATSSKNTVRLVINAIKAHTEANALISVGALTTGAGVMVVDGPIILSGGVNGTSGSLGEERYDTDGVYWKLDYISGDYYYWKSSCCKVANTIYFERYDKVIDKIIYKYLHVGNTPSAAVGDYYLGLIECGAKGLREGIVNMGGGIFFPLPIHDYGTLQFMNEYFPYEYGHLLARIYAQSSAYQNRPFSQEILFFRLEG